MFVISVFDHRKTENRVNEILRYIIFKLYMDYYIIIEESFNNIKAVRNITQNL